MVLWNGLGMVSSPFCILVNFFEMSRDNPFTDCFYILLFNSHMLRFMQQYIILRQ